MLFDFLRKMKPTEDEQDLLDLEQRCRQANIENESNSGGSEGFRMPIEDVFTITGKGTVVTGRIEQGTVVVGDSLWLTGKNGNMYVTVTGIERFRKILNSASAGDNVGILLKDVRRDQLGRGDILTKQ